MYSYAAAAERDRSTLIAFARAHSFAMIIGGGDQYPVASQIPMEITEKNGQLFSGGHIMRKTDHHLAF